MNDPYFRGKLDTLSQNSLKHLYRLTGHTLHCGPLPRPGSSRKGGPWTFRNSRPYAKISLYWLKILISNITMVFSNSSLKNANKARQCWPQIYS